MITNFRVRAIGSGHLSGICITGNHHLYFRKGVDIVRIRRTASGEVVVDIDAKQKPKVENGDTIDVGKGGEPTATTHDMREAERQAEALALDPGTGGRKVHLLKTVAVYEVVPTPEVRCTVL